jgi:SEC-C motif
MTKVGRNDPCPCGSSKKYKKCHPGEYEPSAVLARTIPDMPVVRCFIAEDYEDMGLSPIVIVRKNPDNDKLVIACFMTDIFCLGVKSVLFDPNSNQDRLDVIVDSQPQDMISISYEDARDIILGSVKYARGIGFEPSSDYRAAQVAIESDKPFDYKPELYGKDGRPLYITGPNDNYKQIFDTLEKNVGKGNFDYVIDERSGYVYAQ